ncbi:PP2C family protein-serine/threonine phosphatase [Streptomyces longispororuber]|uniref:PP2C family protein-serine/threonine phosphatase n=1 Tax=Streptomyces longispororuber TaxID=68230 RepID=UPI0021091F83|nr:SpoIIE family protein phosphatase [Streptomyces longispororuber]MCQ4207460.1 SpoIIE family protein phosphatase [Streptomyces longispororuber]
MEDSATPAGPGQDGVAAVRALLGAQAETARRAAVVRIGEDAARAAAEAVPCDRVETPDWAGPLADAHPMPAVVFAPVRDDAGRIVDFVDVAANTPARRYAPRQGSPVGHLLTVTQPTARTSGVFDTLCRAVETGETIAPQDWADTLLIDGHPRHVAGRLTAAPHRGHVLVIIDMDAERYRRISRRAEEDGLGGWAEWDLPAAATEWSPGLHRMFDLPEGAPPLGLDALAAFVVPEDLPGLHTALELLLHEGRPCDVDVRAELPSGERVLRFVMEAVQDEDESGAVWGVQGYIRDVTQVHQVRTRLDAALRDADRRREQARAEARVTARLREALLPAHPPEQAYNGVVSALAHRPAELGVLGGDWYNVRPLPDGRVLYALGDAAGHGLDAVAHMTSLRSGLEGLAFTEHPVETLAAWLNRLTTETHPDRTATAVICRYHPDRRLLRWVSAGHPPPVLIRAGRARLLDVPEGLLLGVLPDAVYRAAELDLLPGDTVLLYSDGLVERRGCDLSDGFDALLNAAEEYAELPLHLLTEKLTDRLLPSAPEDDASLLALRRSGP